MRVLHRHQLPRTEAAFPVWSSLLPSWAWASSPGPLGRAGRGHAVNGRRGGAPTPTTWTCARCGAVEHNLAGVEGVRDTGESRSADRRSVRA